MLEYIRNSAQSFGVKIAFGIIILVFVFWGIGNYNDRDYSNVVAVVNGEPIVAFEFERAYQNAEETLLRQNPGLTREQLAKDNLGRAVLNDLIRETLISQEAARQGIDVSPLELRAAVEQIKAFQNERGEFDPEVYKRMLAARRMSPGQYEHQLANQILQDKLFNLATAGVWIDPDEARNRFNFLKEKRTVDWIFLPAAEFMDKVSVDENEINKWYEEHRADFAIPKRVEVTYIAVLPADLVDQSQISPEAINGWYEANKTRYAQPEQIKARHVLVPLSQDADEAAVAAANAEMERILADLKAGESFSQVADRVNGPGAAGPGGELGWLGRGETVPEFEEAAFALEPGKVSGPVRTQFGLHLILVEEKKKAGLKPLEEVREEAVKALATEAGLEKLPDVLDNLVEDNILQKPLAESAARYGLKAEETGLVDRDGLVKKLGIKDTAADALLEAGDGIPLDTALEAGDKYIVARVTNTVPPDVKPLAEVKEEIEKGLRQKAALEQALKAGGEVLEKVKGKDLAFAKSQYGKIEQDDRLERVGMLPGYRANDQLIEDIFAARPPVWLGKPLAVVKDTGQPGAMVVYVAASAMPGDEEFQPLQDIMARAARQERIEGIYGLFLQSLLDRAKVEITNTNIIDRTS